MDKIFQRAEDKNVAARIVYEADDTLYYDAEHTVEVPEDDMLNLFLKGVLLSDGDGNYFAATKFEDGAIVFEAASEG